MITYREFEKLRLESFVTNPKEIRRLKNFEFMDKLWTGQAIGFTEWLQTGRLVKSTESISVDFDGLSKEEVNNILSTLDIDIKRGMEQRQVLELFGKPNKILTFVEDRKTFEYLIGKEEKYYLSLTVHNSEGLIYFVLSNYKGAIEEVNNGRL
jgi:hypothetical protein